VAAPEHPVLSVVVVIVSDTITPRAKVFHLRSCLDALAHQTNPPSMEIIVPYHEDVDEMEDLVGTHPDVTFIRATSVSIASRKGSGREHHDVLRACGLRAARGEIIALLEDHARPDANWSANVVAAHRQNCAAVGGAIENGIDRTLNWAVYYCDFGKYQNPLPPGESSFASDANTSYKRQALETVRPIWQASFSEVVVNGALIARGEKVILRPEVVIYQNRRDLDFVFALRERFSWGRSYAASRSALLSEARRLVYSILSLGLPIVLLLRMGLTAWKRRAHFTKFVGALPIIVVLLISWSLGESVGYIVAHRPRS
jgi:Glycosyl transferase family 2